MRRRTPTTLAMCTVWSLLATCPVAHASCKDFAVRFASSHGGVGTWAGYDGDCTDIPFCQEEGVSTAIKHECSQTQFQCCMINNEFTPSAAGSCGLFCQSAAPGDAQHPDSTKEPVVKAPMKESKTPGIGIGVIIGIVIGIVLTLVVVAFLINRYRPAPAIPEFTATQADTVSAPVQVSKLPMDEP